MNPLTQSKNTTILPVLSALMLICFALSPKAQAICQDGCNTTNFNTFQGDDALVNNTTGFSNTAIGAFALTSNTTGSWNTAIGEETLASNTTGEANTATGQGALDFNTQGGSNTATGVLALQFNTTGSNNTAIGREALVGNTTGNNNTATGAFALVNNTGNNNTAVGRNALNGNTSGSENIAMGHRAGINLTTGSGNIDIGNRGVAGEAGTIRIGRQRTQTATYIAGISGTAVVGDTVVVDGNGQLGTVASAARFKKEVRPMDKTSEAILALKPVRFQYKSDSRGTPQFGLIAEDVAKVNPELVVRDRKGEIYSVRYEAVNAMLLNEFLKQHNEFLKEHKTVQDQGATIAELKKEIAALTATVKEQTAQIQKVSAQLEVNKTTSEIVLNNQ